MKRSLSGVKICYGRFLFFNGIERKVYIFVRKGNCLYLIRKCLLIIKKAGIQKMREWKIVKT